MVPSQPSVLIGSRPRSYLFGFLFSLSAGLVVVIIQFGWPREIFLEEGVTSRYVVRAEPYGASSARLCVHRMGAGLRYTARNSFREAIQVWQRWVHRFRNTQFRLEERQGERFHKPCSIVTL